MGVKKRKPKKRKQGKSFPILFLATAILSVCAIGVVAVLFLSQADRESSRDLIEEPAAPRAYPYPPIPYPEPRQKEPAPPAIEPAAPDAGLLAIVIDDIGYDLAVVDDLLSLGIPITFGVLPHCPYSVQSARRAHQAGHEVILHLPMEPHGYPERNPGEGALMTTMTEGEIILQLRENLLSVPHARGVNNHMGSRFMEDRERLVMVFSELKEQGLFFLDSRTTNRSEAREAALAVGIDLISRDIFVDNSRLTGETLAVLQGVAESNNRWNRLIVIGHPYESTTKALRKAIPELRDRGIELVHLSRMVEH